MHPIPLRLSPGDDLKGALETLTRQHQLQAGLILTAVGSLSQAHLRFAGQPRGTYLTGPFEIVSLVGTLSLEGLHLHGAIADGRGVTLGGHVLEGCRIHTTAEIVLGAVPGYRFSRALDPATGYRELEISPLQAAAPQR